jgi:hypothetical protein
MLLFGPLFLPHDMFQLGQVLLEEDLIHLTLVFVVIVTLQHSILVNKETNTAKNTLDNDHWIWRSPTAPLRRLIFRVDCVLGNLLLGHILLQRLKEQQIMEAHALFRVLLLLMSRDGVNHLRLLHPGSIFIIAWKFQL